VKIPAMN